MIQDGKVSDKTFSVHSSAVHSKGVKCFSLLDYLITRTNVTRCSVPTVCQPFI